MLAQPSVDPSAISRSTTELGNTGFRRELMTGKSKPIDALFPLFDQIFQHTKIPSFVCAIISYYFYLQIIFTAIWPRNKFWIIVTDTENKIIDMLMSILWFNPKIYTTSTVTIVAIVLTAIFVVMVAYIATIMIYYHRNHRFIVWTLYPVRFMVECLAPILFHPAGALVGNSFLLASVEKESIGVIFLVVGIVDLIGFVSIFAIGFMLSAKSASIFLTPYSMFNPNPLVIFSFGSSILLLLSFFVSVFSDWIVLVLQGIHLLMMIYLIIQFLYFPFHTLKGTATGTSVAIFGVIGDIFLAILYNLPTFPVIYALIIFVGLCIITAPIVYYFMKRRQSGIVRSMNNDHDNVPTDDEKVDLFMNLGLANNEPRALMYLHLAFTNYCDRFIDWSMLRFVAGNIQTNLALSSCVQLLALFPGESRQLNALFFQISSQRDLNYADRFQVYQVYRIKTLRQSSASVDANERLNDLRQQVETLESTIRSFWGMKTASLFFFETISIQCRRLNGLWAEAIRDYPNNGKFSEEYTRFLIECQTDFDLALVQKQRSSMIEMGSNFSIDLPFRSLARSFPNYLKKGIVDIKGNMRATSHKGSSTSERESTAATSQIEIDAELEETLGKLCLTSSKLRLALHRAIDGHTTSSIRMMPWAALVIGVVTLVAFLVSYIFFNIKFGDRSTSMARLEYLADARLFMGMSTLLVLLEWTEKAGLFNDDPDTGLITTLRNEDTELHDGEALPIYFNFEDFDTSMMRYQSRSREALSNLINDLAALATDGVNVYAIGDALMEYTVWSYVCVPQPHSELGGSREQGIEPYQTDLRNVMVLIYYLQAQIAGSWGTAATGSIMDNSDYCEMFLNVDSAIDSIPEVFNTFSSYQIEQGEDLTLIVTIMMIIIPVGIVLCTTLPSAILGIMFARQNGNIGNALLSLDPVVKNECKQPLRRDFDDGDLDVQDAKKVTSRVLITNVILLLMGLAITALCLGMMIYTSSVNTDFDNLNQWVNFAGRRTAVTVECLHDILLLIVLSKADTTGDSIVNEYTFLTSKELHTKIQNAMDTVKQNNDNLLQGTSQSSACFGIDDILDDYNIALACEPEAGVSELHDLYKCASADQAISIFNDYIVGMKENPSAFNGRIDEDKVLNLIHLANAHMWHRLEMAMSRIVDLGIIFYDDLMSILIIFVLVGIIVGIAAVAVAFVVRSEMLSAYNGTLSMIKHVPPIQIVNNKKLMNLLLNKSASRKEEGMSTERSIVQSSQDGIICAGSSGVIELANPAVSEILGYTAEQLLGQPTSIVFNAESQDEMNREMDLMRSGQSSPFYEGHVNCITDNETEVPCAITILGVQGTRGSVESFVIILRDESILIKQQQEAEEAKARSENLLFQILPRDIVIKLNQGEKDISFVVQSASVIFIDMVRFSDYAATLTPDQIMSNLSLIFGAMDTILEKYPLVSKIKLIGDVYMAASGLFSPDEPPSSHAEQIVRFGLDVIQEMEEINLKLNANLSVRVGVNSGGPLIAGVLGTDKPVFDIIGDTINVSARLQSTDIPGRIQIPQSTYDLIKEMNFEIEERGLVFLKGKGKTMAYFVRPFQSFISQLSSQDFKPLAAN